jgi:hypothetical protein
VRIEFLKERYDFELQRKEQLTSALTLPVAVLGGLGSVLALMARSFTYKDPYLISVFLSSIGASLLAFVGCMLFLSAAFHRQRYMYLPLLRDLRAWEEEFRIFITYVESTGEDVDGTFDDNLRERIIEAADRNTTINDERAGLLDRSRGVLLLVLWLTLFTGIPFVVDQVRFVMPRQEVPQQQPAPAQPAPQNTTPQPPQFPPNREIREGDVPRRN